MMKYRLLVTSSKLESSLGGRTRDPKTLFRPKASKPEPAGPLDPKSTRTNRVRRIAYTEAIRPTDPAIHRIIERFALLPNPLKNIFLFYLHQPVVRKPSCVVGGWWRRINEGPVVEHKRAWVRHGKAWVEQGRG